jgi:dTDP-D-glucose 4,6-dehydratase
VDCESFLSVKDFVNLAKQLSESESDIKHVPMRNGEEEVVDAKPVGDHWLRPEMPSLFESMTPLDKGLRETIEWYRQRPSLLDEGLKFYADLEQ